MTEKDKRIVISAHCDDAFLSLGGAILKKNNYKVVDIFSTCTWSINNNLQSSEEITKLNRIEERKVANASNAQLEMLDLPEALLRGYKNWNSKVRVSESEEKLKKEVGETIQKYVREGRYIYFPLAIGGHTDHQIIFESALDHIKLKDNLDNKTIMVYEDLPYATEFDATSQMEILKIYFNPIPILINITNQINEKLRLLTHYKTQLTNHDILSIKEYARKIKTNTDYHERVWEITV